MAQSKYTIDMQNTVFPLLSEQQTRTIIGNAIGQSPGETERPGVAYMHNVMPSRYGMDAVGYTQILPNALGLPIGQSITDVRVIFSTDRNRYYLAFATDGTVFRLNDSGIAWNRLSNNFLTILTSIDPTVVTFDVNKITTGTVNGITYMYYSNVAMFIYQEAADNILQVASVPGLSLPDVIGIVASSGYLIAYTIDALAWSSTIVPTEFTPSQVTGAGGGRVAGTDGNILFVTANSLGVLVYTFNNIVAGTYTGNSRYPFKFREVPASKGGVDLDTIAYEANSKQQFVYSKAGLQAISNNSAEQLLSEVTDFLSGKKFEDFDSDTNSLVTTNLTSSQQMKKKLKYIASRYLIISYGLPTGDFTHALVVDTSLNKVGKLKIEHTDVFEYVGTQVEVARESIAFIASNGVTKYVNFTAANLASGVLIMGKIQASLTRFLGLMEVVLENAPTAITTEVEVLTQASLDGKNFSNVSGYLELADTNIRKFLFRSSAKSHTIMLLGNFNLVTLEIAYIIEGRR